MGFMELPQRKSPRIQKFDYSSTNFYFITICAHEKKCIFGQPGALNWIGECAEEYLRKIFVINPNVRIDKYVVMPNHIHVIFDLQPSQEKVDLAVVIGQYKMAVTKRIREKMPDFPVWQRSFHDHVIRNQADYERIWLYIEGNPQRWDEDCFYVE